MAVRKEKDQDQGRQKRGLPTAAHRPPENQENGAARQERQGQWAQNLEERGLFDIVGIKGKHRVNREEQRVPRFFRQTFHPYLASIQYRRLSES